MGKYNFEHINMINKIHMSLRVGFTITNTFSLVTTKSHAEILCFKTIPQGAPSSELNIKFVHGAPSTAVILYAVDC